MKEPKTKRKMTPPYQWSQEEIDYVMSNYKGCGYINMTKRLIQEFGSNITRFQVKSFYTRNKINSGITGRFEKGHENLNPFPVYKHPNSKKTRFKKGHRPANAKPVGTIIIDRDENRPFRYKKIKVAEPNVWQHLHVHNYEKAFGAYDKTKYCLLFIDGNTLNCDVSNLKLIRKEEHVWLNRYGFDREFTSKEEVETCLAIVNLKSNVSRKKRALKNGGK